MRANFVSDACNVLLVQWSLQKMLPHFLQWCFPRVRKLNLRWHYWQVGASIQCASSRLSQNGIFVSSRRFVFILDEIGIEASLSSLSELDHISWVWLGKVFMVSRATFLANRGLNSGWIFWLEIMFVGKKLWIFSPSLLLTQFFDSSTSKGMLLGTYYFSIIVLLLDAWS